MRVSEDVTQAGLTRLGSVVCWALEPLRRAAVPRGVLVEVRLPPRGARVRGGWDLAEALLLLAAAVLEGLRYGGRLQLRGYLWGDHVVLEIADGEIASGRGRRQERDGRWRASQLDRVAALLAPVRGRLWVGGSSVRLALPLAGRRR